MKMRLTFLMLFVAVMCSAQDMRTNMSRSLFADQKAAQVGDAITIMIVESSSAINDARTSTSRSSDISLGANASTGTGSGTNISGGVGTGNQFKGEGLTSNRGSVRAKMSAQVDSVLANGNLRIRGSRSITINGEEQTISISGIVRPSDVMADNAVFSHNIADATIVVQGDGSITKVQEPGWLTKLFHWLF